MLMLAGFFEAWALACFESNVSNRSQPWHITIAGKKILARCVCDNRCCGRCSIRLSTAILFLGRLGRLGRLGMRQGIVNYRCGVMSLRRGSVCIDLCLQDADRLTAIDKLLLESPMLIE